MQTDEREDAQENAPLSMLASREPVSNTTVESEPHSPKHCLPSCATEEGMQIDEREEAYKNAHSDIHESREPGSKTTVASCDRTNPSPEKE
jgi:hypothetical protein